MNKILETIKLKWAEYLLEIFVIMIGILGAFTLNNWNADRVANVNEQKLLTNIIEDLSTDYQATLELLQKVKRRQEIHLRLYNESIVDISSERSNSYSSEIVHTTDVTSITWDNYKNSIEKISKREIRSELNNYFSSYNILLKFTGDLNEAILNQFRPYLRRHEIINLKIVFESSPDQDDIDRSKFFHSDRLRSEFGTKEFNQVITELFLGTQDVIQSLEILLEKNQLLRTKLKTNLN